MGKVAQKADPALWDRVKAEVTAGDKGGNAGQWSARKAQLAVHEYKRQGGTYVGGKAADNSLEHWSEEDWGTASGHASRETGERYLPKAAREQLSPAEYRRTTAKKRADSRQGAQFSRQPADIAAKTAKVRHAAEAPTRQALYDEARRRDLPGRSRMSKAELQKALHS